MIAPMSSNNEDSKLPISSDQMKGGYIDSDVISGGLMSGDWMRSGGLMSGSLMRCGMMSGGCCLSKE